ncbi:uncharacterized protein [Ptychodera flava]|uniref:uncharacterized protein n=1 Tax=Ptychodera flava TaxID=63121 RepID=UPI00396A492E
MLFTRLTKGISKVQIMKNHVEAFSKLYGLTLPHQRFTKDKPVLFEESAETDKMKCLGMFGFGAFANMQIPAKENISFSIQKHLVRSKEIRDIAEKIAALICDGKPYLAMHFRNKSGESMRCRQWNGTCQFKMSQLSQNVANIVVDIKMLIKQRKSPCLYVAYPIKYSSAVVNILKEGKLETIVDQTTIFNIGFPNMDVFKADNYMLSLLEQEICQRADLFIAWSRSSWSTNVRRRRNGETINLEQLPSWKPITDED